MSFSGDIEKFIKKTERKALIIFKKVSFDMYSNIVRATPVDTGRAKGNWQVMFNKAPVSDVGSDDASKLGSIGGISVSRAATITNNLKLGDRLYMVNNLPYIQKLEDGDSRQAPNGMVKLEVLQFKRRVNQAAKAGFNG